LQEWFVQKFGTPTEPQEQGWPHILAGRTTLISAPTGSGKTLAAFLACIDRLVRKALAGDLHDRTEVLYISPLKALGNDIQKNLEVPLGEILQMAGERGLLMPQIRTAVRTGDTLAHERRAMLKCPPHILVTTPESLYADAEKAGPYCATWKPSSWTKSMPCGRQAWRASYAVAGAAGGADSSAAGAHWTFRHAEAD
jgi:Lhr-like helicase